MMNSVGNANWKLGEKKLSYGKKKWRIEP